MAILSDYTSGTVSASAGGTVVTGSGTAWLTAGFGEGDIFIAPGWSAIVKSVDSNTQVTLYPTGIRGAALTGSTYRMRYMSDGARVSGQTRQLIDLLSGTGSIEALAGVTGQPDKIPMFTGPGTMTLIDRQDLTQGVEYDAFVDDIAARAAYDNEAAGFAVVVADTGDGRSAVYTRVGAAGNWSAPAYITGPAVTLDVTEVDEVPYGTPPDVTLTPTGGGYNLKFEIPRGMMIQPGTVTTVGPDTPASVDFVPITGGYQINFSIPRGPTGDITGVTPFWVTRLGADTTATQARAGLRAAEIDVTEIAGIEPTLDLIFSSPDAIDPAWFTRASVGTYFDARGAMITAAENEPRIEFDPVTGELLGLLVEEQRTNLLWPSEDFTHTRWVKTRVSVSLGPVIRGMQFWNWVPDTSTATSHSMNQSPTFAALANDTVFTSSIYVKSNGASTTRIAFRFADTVGFRVYVFFNLATGQFTGGHDDPSIVSAQATHIGDGIYRIEIAYTVRATSTYATIQPHAASPDSNSTTTYDFNGTDGYLIACPQIEEGAFATSYIPTTATAVTRAFDSCTINDFWASEAFNRYEFTAYAEYARTSHSTIGRIIDRVSSNNGFLLRTLPDGRVRFELPNESSTLVYSTANMNLTGVNKAAATISQLGAIAALNGVAGTASGPLATGLPAGATGSAKIGSSGANGEHLNGHIRRVTYFPRAMTNTQLQAITA